MKTGFFIATFNLPDTRHRVLWSAGTWNVGESYDEGLPNILATWNAIFDSPTALLNTVRESSFDYITGAFYGQGTHSTRKSIGGTNGSYPGYTGLGFDASRSNSIYGASQSVRPRCIVVEMMIKY